MENENVLSTNEIIENFENTIIVEENIVQAETLEIMGDSVDTVSTSMDTGNLETISQNTYDLLEDFTTINASMSFIIVLLLLSILLIISIHFITERRKV